MQEGEIVWDEMAAQYVSATGRSGADTTTYAVKAADAAAAAVAASDHTYHTVINPAHLSGTLPGTDMAAAAAALTSKSPAAANTAANGEARERVVMPPTGPVLQHPSRFASNSNAGTYPGVPTAAAGSFSHPAEASPELSTSVKALRGKTTVDFPSTFQHPSFLAPQKPPHPSHPFLSGLPANVCWPPNGSVSHPQSSRSKRQRRTGWPGPSLAEHESDHVWNSSVHQAGFKVVALEASARGATGNTKLSPPQALPQVRNVVQA